jgi:lipopolysaccharide transport system ATP-binding protein
MASGKHAIVVSNVTKHFKKVAKRREYTTVKSELLRFIKGERPVNEPTQHIEALKGVDLVVPKGSTVGIIGRNGSGKSTLLKLITGIYTPTSGTVQVNGRISALLELGAGFHPDFSGRENILINGIILGMSRAEVKNRIDEIIAFAELGDFIDEPVRTYSSGMFMRLAFAVATHVDPEVLIVDEILSVGDEHFAKKSQAKMSEFKTSGKTILLVTHSLDTVERWCDLAVWIDGGRTRLMGSPAHVVAEYRRAVNAAEIETAKTGHSALSAPGLALPESTKPPSALETLRAVSVSVVDASGQRPQAFAADSKLDVLVDFEATAAQAGECSVDVQTADGRLLFSSTFLTGSLPVGTGRARLSFPRVGLGEGSWTVAASMHAPGATPMTAATTSFLVAPHPGVGLVRPQHVWSVEGRSPGVETEVQGQPVARA